MSEILIIPQSSVSKQEKYDVLIPQIKALVSGESDLIANLANISAVLHYGMGFFWIGFYLVKNEELVLGPFQGPIACTRIRKGKGVCGASWEQGKAIVVENVDEFPGHIACSSDSKSEIVLPAFKDGKVILIMDVDSDILSDFDTTDELYLQKIIDLIERMA
jgi:L-methionine (R)-S-oxide reductase